VATRWTSTIATNTREPTAVAATGPASAGAQEDLAELTGQTVHDNHEHVHQDEHAERAQPQEWTLRAPCLPPNSRPYLGKRASTAGDIAAPEAICRGASRNTTAK
jgi:hypothetical protein